MDKSLKRNRPQFSITMDPDLKVKLEKLASLSGISLSEFIEELGYSAVEKIDEKRWAQIDETIRMVREIREKYGADPRRKGRG